VILFFVGVVLHLTVIILDYRALVYLVASVDTEQQTQSRST
jgi:hypothetical protein